MEYIPNCFNSTCILSFPSSLSHTDSKSQSISGKGTSVLKEAAEFPAVLKNELKFTENRNRIIYILLGF